MVDVKSKCQTRKNRRSLRKNKRKICDKKLVLVGVNSAGLTSKLSSFEHLLNSLEPSIFFIEETKMKTQGKIKTKNSQRYQIFELVRKDKCGGGLAIGALMISTQCGYLRVTMRLKF